MLEEKNYFAENLRYLRQLKGLNLVELGEAFDLGKSQISLYENAKSYPPMPLARKISKFFGLTLDQLFESDVRPQEPSPPKNGKHLSLMNGNAEGSYKGQRQEAVPLVANDVGRVSTEGESPPKEEDDTELTREELKQMKKFLQAMKLAEAI
jgi:transcriptional regulator with XRE-family HTH domain